MDEPEEGCGEGRVDRPDDGRDHSVMQDNDVDDLLPEKSK